MLVEYYSRARMELMRPTFFGIHISVRICGLTLSSIIWNYLSKKTPAMQTILDAMIKDLILVGHFCIFFGDCVYISCGFYPIPFYLAYFFTIATLIFCIYFIFQFFIAFIVQYLYVFHDYILSYLTDDDWIKRTRFFCQSMSLILTSIEIWQEDHSKGMLFQGMVYGRDKENWKHEVKEPRIMTFGFVIIIQTACVLLIHVRIELYKAEEMRSFRLMILGGITLFIILCIRFYSLAVDSFSIHILVSILVGIFGQGLLIDSMPGMKNFAKEYLAMLPKIMRFFKIN